MYTIFSIVYVLYSSMWQSLLQGNWCSNETITRNHEFDLPKLVNQRMLLCRCARTTARTVTIHKAEHAMKQHFLVTQFDRILRYTLSVCNKNKNRLLTLSWFGYTDITQVWTVLIQPTPYNCKLISTRNVGCIAILFLCTVIDTL